MPILRGTEVADLPLLAKGSPPRHPLPIPAVTLARAFSNTFAGIRPADVPSFVVAQLLDCIPSAQPRTYPSMPELFTT